MLAEVAVYLAPFGLSAARKLYRSMGAGLTSLSGLWSSIAPSGIVAALPAEWTRWNGARPELRGAPTDTILDYVGIEKTTPAFRRALLDASEKLGVPVDSLALIMSHESGFNPKAKNPLPAAGLIQITRGANLPGFDTDEKILAVLDMSPEEQIEKVVIPYYLRFGDKLKGANPGRILMANFLPGKMGGDESTMLGVCPPELLPFIGDPRAFAAGLAKLTDPKEPGSRSLTFDEKVYCWNPGMDRNRDGKITISDVYEDAASVAKRAGGKRIRIDGSIWSPDDASSAPAGAAVSTMVASGQKAPEKASAPVQGGKPAPTVASAGQRPSSAPSGGITLAAVMDGSAVLPPMVDVALPSGLVVACMTDAVCTPWEGSGYVRFPVTYEETIACCNKLDCLPLTAEIADLLWKNAPVHLRPVGLVISADDAKRMATVEWSLKHDASLINPENASNGQAWIAGDYVSDLGKDWILDPGIAQSGAVNYGWRTLEGKPTQSIGHQHNAKHYDYSQVLRLMRRNGTYQGQTVALLERPDLWLPPNFPAALLAPFKV